VEKQPDAIENLLGSPSGLGIDFSIRFRWVPALHHRLLSTMHPA